MNNNLTCDSYPGISLEQAKKNVSCNINNTELESLYYDDEFFHNGILYIPYGITKVKKIYIDNVECKKIVFPNTVTIIGERSIQCKNVEEVILPERLSIIEKNAFSFCKKLNKINFPSSLTSIGAEAFSWTSIREAILPDGVKIGKDAFEGCKKLLNLRLPADIENVPINCLNIGINKLPKKVKKIGSKTGMKHFTHQIELFIPKSLVEVFLDNSFGYNPLIINYEGSKKEFELIKFENLYYKNCIINYNCEYNYESYENWPRLKYYSNGEIEFFGEYLLSINTNRKSISIPEGIKYVVEDNFFHNDIKHSSLKEIIFPKSMYILPNIMLSFDKYDYSKLDAMKFDYIFSGNYISEWDIDIGKTNIFLKNVKFTYNSVLSNKAPVVAYENDDIIIYDDCVWINSDFIRYVKTPNSVKEIELGNCRFLEAVILSKKVESIIFSSKKNNCTCIKNLYIPCSVQIIYFSNYSAAHIENVFFEGDKDDWNSILNKLDKNNKDISLIIDNVYYEKYNECEKYTFDELKKLEDTIGYNAILPKKPVTSIISINNHKESKNKGIDKNMHKIKPIKKDKTPSIKDSKNFLSNESKNKFNPSEYYYVIFSNQRNETEDCFIKKPINISKNEIINKLTYDINRGYLSYIEHSNISFSFDDTDSLRKALWGIHNELKIISRGVNPVESNEFKLLNKISSKMEKINIYIDATDYFENTEDGDLIDCTFYDTLQELLEDYDECDVKIYNNKNIIVFDDFYFSDFDDDISIYMKRKNDKAYFSDNRYKLTVYLK